MSSITKQLFSGDSTGLGLGSSLLWHRLCRVWPQWGNYLYNTTLWSESVQCSYNFTSLLVPSSQGLLSTASWPTYRPLRLAPLSALGTLWSTCPSAFADHRPLHSGWLFGRPLLTFSRTGMKWLVRGCAATMPSCAWCLCQWNLRKDRIKWKIKSNKGVHNQKKSEMSKYVWNKGSFIQETELVQGATCLIRHYFWRIIKTEIRQTCLYKKKYFMWGN